MKNRYLKLIGMLLITQSITGCFERKEIPSDSQPRSIIVSPTPSQSISPTPSPSPSTSPLDFPETPKNVQVVSGDHQVTLTWFPSQRAESYYVIRALVNHGSSEFSRVATCNSIQTVRCVDKNVTNGDVYHYGVIAVNSRGNSNVSEIVQGFPRAPQPPNIKFVESDRVSRIGEALVPLVADNKGGAITSCEVTPSLPAGLSINSGCKIAGTPQGPVQSKKYYTVTAKNKDGISEAKISIEIKPKKEMINFKLIPHQPVVYSQSNGFEVVSASGNQGDVDFSCGNTACTDYFSQSEKNNVLTLRPNAKGDAIKVAVKIEVKAKDTAGNTAETSFDFAPYLQAVKAKGVIYLDVIGGNPTEVKDLCDFKKNFDGDVQLSTFYEDHYYITGAFKHYKGVVAPGFAKVNSKTCKLDTLFTQKTAFNDSTKVRGIIANSLGVFVAGDFNIYRGKTLFGNTGTSFGGVLIRIQLDDGSLDPKFKPAVILQSSGKGYFISNVLQSGTSLIVSGGFSTINNQRVSNLAKLDALTGTLDIAASSKLSKSGYVYRTLLIGNSVLVGGCGVSKNKISTGEAEPGFKPYDVCYDEYDDEFMTFTYSEFDKFIYVALRTGMNNHRVVKLDSVTGHEKPFGTLPLLKFDYFIQSLVIIKNALFVSGNFTHYQTPTKTFSAQRLAKINVNTGALDQVFTKEKGFNDTVYGCININNVVIECGGPFTQYR